MVFLLFIVLNKKYVVGLFFLFVCFSLTCLLVSIKKFQGKRNSKLTFAVIFCFQFCAIDSFPEGTIGLLQRHLKKIKIKKIKKNMNTLSHAAIRTLTFQMH